MSLRGLLNDSQMPSIALPSAAAKLAAAAAGGGAVIHEKLTGYVRQQQQQTEWCWAACTCSVSLFFSPASTWTQCGLADDQLAQTTCCSAGGSSSCNRWWYFDRSLSRTSNLYTWSAGTIPGTSIASQLHSGRPVGCRIQWSDGSGHFVVLDGYDDDGTTQTVDVQDPFYGFSTEDYASFCTAYHGNGTWTHTYYTQP